MDEICDADFIECDSEVDALLVESRLIKDIQPKNNKEQKDDKTFPYLMITTREDFPRVEVTREPRDRGVKLYGPFASAGSLRGAVQVLQRIFKFRTCSLDIDEGDERWRWFRPCLLASINQCTAPCNLRISKEDYRRDIRRLQMFLEGKKQALLPQMREEMASGLASSCSLNGRLACATKSRCSRRSISAANWTRMPSRKSSSSIPKKGLPGLRKVLKLTSTPRTIEGIDIAHLQGGQTVASLVQFIDGLPFKPGYRRYKIRSVQGIDDFRSIHEVVARRYRRLYDESEMFPDVILIDGGKGQLQRGGRGISRTGDRSADHSCRWPSETRRSFLPDQCGAAAAEPARLCPATAAVRARRSASLRPALSSHAAQTIDARVHAASRRASRNARRTPENHIAIADRQGYR